MQKFLKCMENKGQGILDITITPKKVVTVSDTSKELAIIQTDRMNLSLLLLKLKSGDPAILEAFT